MGLLGTVIGMIRAFKALHEQVLRTQWLYQPVSLKRLSILALQYLNFSHRHHHVQLLLTNKIDTLTYGMDEAGYSVVQTFASKYKDAK